MAEFGFFSFSESFKPGIDFNTPDESIGIASNLTIQTNLAVNALIERLVSSSLTVESNSTATALRIVHAQSSIIVDGATLTLGTKIKLASIALSVESNLTSNLIKTALSASSINVDSSASIIARRITLAEISVSGNATAIASIIKTAKASSVITPTSNVATSAIKIMNISSVVSGNVNLTIVGKIVLAIMKINNLFGNTNVSIKAIKFSNAGVDSSLIRSLLMLDGVPLTDQNRKMDVAAAPVYVENINWQGDASRYYRNSANGFAAKRTFNLQWSFIPNYENKTVDSKASRNYLNKKSKDADVHTLTIIKQDQNGTTPYTEEDVDVLIVSYTESLIRRDLVDDVYYFNCSMSLQEV